MAADIVPIRLGLTRGDLYTLWAPRWRDAGDEWEALLGKDEDLYAFESVADLAAFVRTNSDNDLADHPAWEELTEASAHRFDPAEDRQYDLIGVQEQSVNLLQSQLQDQQNRFEAGTVPRFNVLQAQVALSNQIPALIAARNNYRISQLQLSRTLGLDFDSTAVETVTIRGFEGFRPYRGCDRRWKGGEAACHQGSRFIPHWTAFGRSQSQLSSSTTRTPRGCLAGSLVSTCSS
jgi:hypothetical protein